MASSFTIKEKVKIVFLYAKFENFEEVQRQWKNHFSTEPPNSTTISRIVKRFEETGSVHDRDRSGRPRSVVTNDTVEEVEKLFVKTPKTLVREGA